jgi:hypothetical protein
MAAITAWAQAGFRFAWNAQPRVVGWSHAVSVAWPLSLLLLAISVALWAGLARDIGFAADGAHYFVTMVDGFGFKLSNWSRLHSNYAMQWPVALAMRFGITDLGTLKWLFDFGMHQYFVLSVAACVFALRGLDKSLLIFPLMSFILVVMPQGYNLFGEACFLAVVVWPLLFLLLRPALARIDYAAVFVLLLMFWRSYETAPAAAVVMAYVAVLRWRAAPAGERWFWQGVIGLLLGIAAFQAWWIVFPGSSDNRGWFTIGLFATLLNACLIASVLAIAFLIAGFALKQQTLVIAAFAIAVLTLMMPLLGIYTGAFVSFAARSLTLSLLPLLLIAAWLTAGTSWLGRREIALLSALGAVLAFGFAGSWGGWYHYKARVETALARHSGYVPLASTGLLPDRYSWKWTMPTLSVLWSDKCVGTVILARPEDWHPYDPRQRLPLKQHRLFRTDLLTGAAGAKSCPSS